MIFLAAQYTPGIEIVFTAWIKSHDQGSEAFEQVPLLWFVEIIGSHHLCWAVLNDHILAVYLLLDIEILYINVVGLFGAGTLTNMAQQNIAGIVLHEDHLLDVNPLCQHEVACP